MRQSITHVALVVRDYDEAIAFYCGVLGFDPHRLVLVVAHQGFQVGARGVEDAEVELTFDPPWTPDRMSEEAQIAVGWY